MADLPHPVGGSRSECIRRATVAAQPSASPHPLAILPHPAVGLAANDGYAPARQAPLMGLLPMP
jgi:hypothetical protein